MFTSTARRLPRLARRSVLLVICILCLAFSAISASAQMGGNPPAGDPPAGAPPGGGGPGADSGTNPVLNSTCGAVLLDGTTGETAADASYDSATTDVSALCLINGATLDLTNVTVTKTGDTSSDENSSFYGLNAGVLVGSGSSFTMTGGTVTTEGSGTNGVFSTGEGTTVTLTDVTIEAVGNGAHAVMATQGGAMTLVNVDMLTTDAHSGAVATDRGSGTIAVTGGEITTTGTDSPGLYSTGVITVDGATVHSTGAEVVVIEGANSVILTDTDLVSSFADKWGVMLYQSFSGDAEGSEGVFTMTGGSLAYTSETGPLFFITNATGTITLSDVEVSVGSAVLGLASATERWGTSGANGGHLVLIADEQSLNGDFVADAISTLSITLTNSSTLTGAVNADDAAARAQVTLDATSLWTLTADSYLTSVSGMHISGDSITNISGNGFNLYYDATDAANSALNAGTYALVNGGSLLPST